MFLGVFYATFDIVTTSLPVPLFDLTPIKPRGELGTSAEVWVGRSINRHLALRYATAPPRFREIGNPIGLSALSKAYCHPYLCPKTPERACFVK